MAKKPPLVLKGYSFFKVLLGDFKEKLHIPPAFANKFVDNLPLKCTLTTYAGRSWHVEVDRVANHLLLQNSWPLFVEENMLELGDFLVFYYDGHSQFEVKIFGKSGCERNCAQVDENCEERISHGEWGAQQKGEDSNGRIVTDGCKCYNKKKLLDYFSQRGQQFLAEQRCAVDSCPFHLVHPHFTRPWKNIKYSMHVPIMFSKACNFHSKKHVVIHDHTNRKWKLKLLKKTKGESYFGTPWFRFSKCHHLREGDVLAFEFIKGEGRGHKRKIQVHIFRNGRLVGKKPSPS